MVRRNRAGDGGKGGRGVRRESRGHQGMKAAVSRRWKLIGTRVSLCFCLFVCLLLFLSVYV